MREDRVLTAALLVLLIVAILHPAIGLSATADFVIEVPVEMRNIPEVMDPMHVDLTLYDAKNQYLLSTGFMIPPSNTNPDGTHDYVQTITISDFPGTPLQTLQKADHYKVYLMSTKAGAQFYKQMKLDPAKPFRAETSGDIKRP